MTGVAPRGRARRIGVGDVAPDFALPDAQGRTVRLSEFRGRIVVLYFYPGDFTPVCTIQACAFRDAYEAFAEAGTHVIGVSTDPPERHRAFAQRHALPFTLLSDHAGEARTAYGVPRTWGLLPGRVTYIIDRDGVIRHVFTSQFRPRAHIAQALRIIAALNRNRPA